MRRKVGPLIVVAALTGCAATSEHAGHGAAPYAGQQSRDIKVLSADEARGYSEGAGMGFANAAELNGYPGPMHALENADALGQIAAVQARLRASHLKAHIATTALLTPEQVDRYNRSRGYASH